MIALWAPPSTYKIQEHGFCCYKMIMQIRKWQNVHIAQVVRSRETCGGIAKVPGRGFQGSKDPTCSRCFWRLLPHAVSV